MRNLDQHPGAVSGFRIAPAGTAVRQVDQDLNALQDNVVRLLALDVHHEADTTGIVFVLPDRTGPGLKVNREVQADHSLLSFVSSQCRGMASPGSLRGDSTAIACDTARMKGS